MKKYLVIGNPIEHSLSPKLHNYWIKKNNINAIYEKKLLEEKEIKSVISDVRSKKISGINVTVPFKKVVIPFLDHLSSEAEETQSVNTIYLENNKIIGHNTDIAGFVLGIKSINYQVKNKNIFILGAGGVVPSIILALKQMGAAKIIVSNRTKEKAQDLKRLFPNLEILNWGDMADFNMIINATSIGLKNKDKINLEYKNIEPDKLFYDLIYNPVETNFLKNAKQMGNQTENGKMMFIYQAHQSFTIWHKIMPEIDEKVIKLLDV
ncbi:MAG: shikimate dehydrogenase [Candidatus Pelagibacterales bacterium]|nr:MAG: shikimate dehydrogenase [Pelagibacterales bacterium]|tara:strand:- start:5530 stop:6324 length:795 start_codon:yes stop_codon:yes gene_type:complete